LWVCLSAGGIKRFPVLPNIESLTIFADNDANEVGQSAALQCGSTWKDVGREVRIYTTPETGTDFADWMRP
jgi:putative DNA primase/helicase